MATTDSQEQNLFSLIGRSWAADAPIADLCFDFDCRSVAYLTAKGSVRLAPTSDPDPVSKRARIQADAGRLTIAPRTKQVKPLVDVSLPDEMFLILRPCPSGGFVGATSNGRLVQISSDGSQQVLSDDRYDEPVALATSKPGSRIGILAENEVCITDAQGQVIARHVLERPAQDIDFSPDGSRIVLCDEHGVSTYRVANGSIRQDHKIAHDGHHIGVAWSPSGKFVTTALEGSGLCTWRLEDNASISMTGFPSESRHFGWGPHDRFLATSGAYRIICWPLGDADFTAEQSLPLETGMMGVVLVTATAAQSKRELVAAGYANGIVVVSKAGSPDELVVRGTDGDAVTCMAWTSDGLGLAFGTTDGNAAMVTFPELMLK